MKKIAPILLLSALLLIGAGCGSKPAADKASNTNGSATSTNLRKLPRSALPKGLGESALPLKQLAAAPDKAFLVKGRGDCSGKYSIGEHHAAKNDKGGTVGLGYDVFLGSGDNSRVGDVIVQTEAQYKAWQTTMHGYTLASRVSDEFVSYNMTNPPKDCVIFAAEK